MKPPSILLILMLARTLTPAATGVLTNKEIAMAQGYAGTNLTVFKAAITEANFAFLGFHSTNELSEMALTNPLVVYAISPARLGNYHLGDDFSTLLEPWSHVIFPIVVSTNVRSSVAFHFDPGAGRASEVKFGQRKLIRELMETYRSVPAAQLKPREAPFAVEIPLFDIWLIGYVNTQDRVVLLATVDLRLGPIIISRGQPITEAAMLRLSTIAQNHNGLPN